jgi:precorrin-3B C17-methyltransferase
LSSTPTSAGRLFIVGIGPGDRSNVTSRAAGVLESVDCIIGYEGYIDLVRAWLPEADFSSSMLGHERERASQAVDWAITGRNVALIGSGDAGIYGLASLALEVLTERKAADLKVEVIPGVTAATAAAALLGAPLGHDFAVISLSDLLTPWEIIRRRLEAVAAADFVTVFYNPAGHKRRAGLEEALEIFRRYRDPATPVGHVQSAHRDAQRVNVSTLGSFDAADVNMLSTIIIGSSTTKRWNGRMITPRGYASET